MDCVFPGVGSVWQRLLSCCCHSIFSHYFPSSCKIFPFFSFFLLFLIPVFSSFSFYLLFSPSPLPLLSGAETEGECKEPRDLGFLKTLKFACFQHYQLTTSTFYLFQWKISKSDGHLRSNSIVHNMWTSGNTTKLLHLKISLQTNKYDVEISI